MRKKHYTQHIGVLLSDDSYQKLIRVTDEAEEPVSKFVRDIIEDQLDQFKEKGELDNGE